MLRKYAMLLAPSPAVMDPPAGGAPIPEEPPGYGEADFAKSMAAAFKGMNAPEPLKTADAPTGDPPPDPPEKKVDAPPVEKKEDKAPDKAGDKLADKGAKDDGDPHAHRKMPQTAADWERYKAADAKRLAAVSEKLAQTEGQYKELEAQLAESAKKVETAPDTEKLVQAAVAEKDKLIQELMDEFAMTAAEKNPALVKHYDGKTKVAQDKAKTLLGDEKGAAFIKLLTIQDGEYKDAKLSEFYAELDPRMTGRLTAIEDNLVDIAADKAAAIADEKARGEHMKGEHANQQKVQSEQQQKAYEKAYTTTLARLQDAKTGLAVFQKKDGDEAWNKGVGERIGQVMDLLTKASPERAIEGAFRAVALQSVLNSFGAASKAWGEEKKALEAKVAALTSATPGGSGKNGSSAGDGAGNGEIKRDDSPDSVLKRMARSTISAWNQQ